LSKHSLTAFIYDKRGKVLSVGKNSYVKTHPLMAKYANLVGEPYRIYLHAEMEAIIKCKYLSKAKSIFIARYDKLGNPANAKPCKICASALKSIGIEDIKHT
jgi:tRNA(Arg) A34 adenosine deaminase TadA